MEDNSNNTTKLYDLSQILSIGNGNVQFVQKMLALFIEHTPPSIKQIREAFKNKDFITLSRTAHKIKPSINSLKISNISEEIMHLSKITKNDFTDEEILSMINKVDDTIIQVIEDLKNEKL